MRIPPLPLAQQNANTSRNGFKSRSELITITLLLPFPLCGLDADHKNNNNHSNNNNNDNNNNNNDNNNNNNNNNNNSNMLTCCARQRRSQGKARERCDGSWKTLLLEPFLRGDVWTSSPQNVSMLWQPTPMSFKSSMHPRILVQKHWIAPSSIYPASYFMIRNSVCKGVTIIEAMCGHQAPQMLSFPDVDPVSAHTDSDIRWGKLSIWGA